MTEQLEARIVELEKRAKFAESKLAAVSGGGGGASDEATLKRLNDIRKLIVEDQRDAETVVAKKNELEVENSKLKDEVGKLNYRIAHLLRALEATDKK